MPSFSNVVVQGNLTADPEVRSSAKGTTVTGIRVAVNHVMGSADNGDRLETTSYFAVVVFGKQGETVGRVLKKGANVTVIGRLNQARWEDEQGNRRERVEIVARDVIFGQKARGSVQAVAEADGPRMQRDEAAIAMVREAGEWNGGAQ